MTRTVGVFLVIAAVGICLLGAAFLAVSMNAGNLTSSGAVLGAVLLFIIVAPLAGGGVFGLVRGRQEESQQAEADRQRKLLDMIKSRGQLSVADAIIEMQADFQTVKDMIYKLTGLGVFSGYVNWDDGVLYSGDAAELRAITECKNCGAKVKFSGKGVQTCPNCGTEYLLGT